MNSVPLSVTVKVLRAGALIPSFAHKIAVAFGIQTVAPQTLVPGGWPMISGWWKMDSHRTRPESFRVTSPPRLLEETLGHLRFDRHLAAIMAASICVPCNMPYVNDIWLPRVRSDRPPAVPQGA